MLILQEKCLKYKWTIRETKRTLRPDYNRRILWKNIFKQTQSWNGKGWQPIIRIHMEERKESKPMFPILRKIKKDNVASYVVSFVSRLVHSTRDQRLYKEICSIRIWNWQTRWSQRRLILGDRDIWPMQVATYAKYPYATRSHVFQGKTRHVGKSFTHRTIYGVANV